MASDKNPSSNAASSSPSLDRDLLAILAGMLPFSNIEALIAFFLTQAEGHLARIRAVLSEACSVATASLREWLDQRRCADGQTCEAYSAVTGESRRVAV